MGSNPTPATNKMKLLFEHNYDSKTKLQVFENDFREIVWLVNNQIHLLQNKMYLNNPCSFGKLIDENIFCSSPKILIGGLGLGKTANTTRDLIANSIVDVVECSQDVIDFYHANNPEAPNINIIKEDFFDYLNATTKTYDCIFMQLDFAGCSPTHREYQLCMKSNERIYTKEFYQKIYSSLTNNSCFIFDGITEVDDHTITENLDECGFITEEDRDNYWREEIIDIERVTWIARKNEHFCSK